MRAYRIYATDLRSGESVILVIEARIMGEARKQANKQGFQVDRIEPIRDFQFETADVLP